jgi:ketol-acid reductoisomerase
MRSDVFDLSTIKLAGRTETVLAAGRHLFPLLPRAFAGISQIGVIGWGSQGPAQAQNLRESLAGTGIRVTVGLRAGSPSWQSAQDCGFHEDDGTLGEMLEVVSASDLAILLISDAAMASRHAEVFAALKPGATLGLSHGFLLGHLRASDADFPESVSVIGVCPKGMGPSVRRLYEQGRYIDGAGINASVAVHRDLDGRAADRALGWAVAIGAPYIFETTLESEYLSDLVGERSILLGAAHGIVESLYRRFLQLGDTAEQAFARSAECITGPLSHAISHDGLRGAVDSFHDDDRRTFEDAYASTYPAALAVVAEIYDEVASGNEIRSVVLAGGRLERFPMTEIDGSRMWAVGQAVRARRDELAAELDPLTAGVFCGAMMAQVDLLAERGHPWSEIANESIIEAVDSLIPYMHARGVAYMVDNCSTTARLGARKWGPRFEAALNHTVFPILDSAGPADRTPAKEFWDHPVHHVLATVAEYRPSVDIAVT